MVLGPWVPALRFAPAGMTSMGRRTKLSSRNSPKANIRDPGAAHDALSLVALAGYARKYVSWCEVASIFPSRDHMAAIWSE